MNKDNKPVLSEAEGLIPKYRFPEFKDDGSWFVDKIGNIFTVTRGQVLSMTNVVEIIDSKNIYPVYSSQTKNGGLAGYYKDFLFQDAITWTTDGANAGDVNFRQGKFYCTNVCGVLLNNEGFTNKFFAEILNTVTRSHVSYVGNPKLMNGVMSEIIIPFPKLKEQQKIADCLSSLDDVIAGHEEKLTALEEHKKGLMQNLFPQEGETKPKYRFPEFENDGDWVEKTIANITTKVSDGIHTTPKYSDDGKYYFINGNNLIDNKIVFDINTKRVSENEYLKHKKDLGSGTILLSINGTIGNIAFYSDEKVLLGKSACYINCDESKVLKIFLANQIKTNRVLTFFNSQLTGAVIKNLSLKTIKETIIYLPTNIEEQQKIASVLSSVDELIVVQREKIEALKAHKKGLMQGLFPKIES